MISGVEIIGADLLKADPTRKASKLPLFEKGQVIDAKVLKLFSYSKAELLIQGKKVLVKTDSEVRLKQGENLQLKATPQGKLNILKVLTGEQKDLLGSPQESRNILSAGSRNIPSLRETIRYFIKNDPLGGFIKLAQAQISSPLPPSSSPELRGNSAPPVSVGAGTDSASSTAPHLSKEFNASDLASIKNLIRSMALKSHRADTLFLPRLLEKSGILLEKKVANFILSRQSESHADKSDPKTPSLSTPNIPAEPSRNRAWEFPPALNKMELPEKLFREDLKAAALQMMEASDDVEAGKEMPALKEFVQNLEKVQLLNAHLSESGKYLLPFPMFSSEQFSFGQIFLDLGEKEQEGGSRADQLLKVSLFLSMTRLGPVRADFSMLKNNISGVFQVSDPEIARFFNEMLPELTQRLRKHDYLVRNITCRVVEKENLTENSIINEILKGEAGSLSVVA